MRPGQDEFVNPMNVQSYIPLQNGLSAMRNVSGMSLHREPTTTVNPFSHQPDAPSLYPPQPIPVNQMVSEMSNYQPRGQPSQLSSAQFMTAMERPPSQIEPSTFLIRNNSGAQLFHNPSAIEPMPIRHIDSDTIKLIHMPNGGGRPTSRVLPGPSMEFQDPNKPMGLAPQRQQFSKSIETGTFKVEEPPKVTFTNPFQAAAGGFESPIQMQ